MTATVTTPRTGLAGGALVAIGALALSFKAIFIKLAYHDAPALDASTLLALRMALALPFFVLMAGWAGRRAPDGDGLRDDLPAILGLGFTGYYLASLLDLSGLQYLSAGLERVILFTYPTLVVLLMALRARRAPAGRELVALALSYGGIVVVYSAQADAAAPEVLHGSLLVFGSAAAFAVFMANSGAAIQRLGSLRFTAYTMIVACVLSLIHFGATHEADEILRQSQRVYALAVLLALVSTVAPTLLVAEGIRRIGAGPAAIISSLGPVATLLLAAALLGEALTARQLLGTLIILAGVGLIGRRRE